MIIGRRVSCEPAAARPELVDDPVAGLVGGAQRVALLDDLLVGHQGLGPVHRTEADAEQGRAPCVTPSAKLEALASPMPGTKIVVSRLIAK